MKSLSCNLKENRATSVVPGDFDGDGFSDILTTSVDTNSGKIKVYIHWGGGNYINCSKPNAPMVILDAQPLAMDYNQDPAIDLFGVKDNIAGFWLISNRTTTINATILLGRNSSWPELRKPHSHAFLDVNNDYFADLILSTEKGYEVWLGNQSLQYTFNTSYDNPPEAPHIGQSLFVDINISGHLEHLVPVCLDETCKDCTLFTHSSLGLNSKEKWKNLSPIMKDSNGLNWCFTNKDPVNTRTIRAGDFNMDGHPDLLASLSDGKSDPRTYLLENVIGNSGGRTFQIKWDALSPLSNSSVLGTFYDLYQDGVLDVIFAGKSRAQAFRNTLDYDANFIKVMVLGGGSVPGAHVSYHTTTLEGAPRVAATVQLSQSAHFTLALPYVIFGLGRTPNFVDSLDVSVGGNSKEWTQVIPNSQLVVTTRLPKWRARLFVTPSKLVLRSVFALLTTCAFIGSLIGILYWKERREDRLEKLQEAHRFHFDAM